MSNLKVLMVCDLDYWILGEIARQLSSRLVDLEVVVLVAHSQDFRNKFRKIQNEYDVIHFLSPWDFFEYSDQVFKPCVVNLWHMVDWTIFDKKVSRIDTLCVGSEQWRTLSKKKTPIPLPLMRMPYGLDIIRFSKNSDARLSFIKSKELPENVIIFGFAGSGWSNEGNRKGLDRLWRCLSEIKTNFEEPFVIRFMGKHWDKDIVPRELIENTIFDYDKSAKEIPDFYSTLDYYVCTSRTEGVPYPVLEAMSCQCTVFSTEVGIVPEIFENFKNGILLREDFIVEDFLNSFSQTYQNKELRTQIGIAARNTVERFLDWNKINTAHFNDIYGSAIRFYSCRSNVEKLSYHVKYLISTPRMLIRKVTIKLSNLANRISKKLFYSVRQG